MKQKILGTVNDFSDARGDLRSKTTATNGNDLWGSLEGYRNRVDMEAARLTAIKIEFARLSPSRRLEVLRYAEYVDSVLSEKDE